MKKNQINGEQILAELDLPAYVHVPFVSCSYNNFSPAFSELVKYFEDTASGSSRGKSNYAIRVLFARCINDLVSGFHLSTHGYVNQAHSVLRSILESQDKIELFSQDKSYAEIWIEGGKVARKKLSPSNVRKLLEREKGNIYSKMYGLFCELGPHPTYKSTQVISYLKKKGGENEKIVIKIGPTDLFRPILFIISFCFLLMMSISLSMSKYLGDKGNKDESLLFTQFEKLDSYLNNCAKKAFLEYEEELPSLFNEILSIAKKQKDGIDDYQKKVSD